jgi:hypothetical protein
MNRLATILVLGFALWAFAVLAQPPAPAAIKPHVRYKAVVVPKQALLLRPAAAVIAPAPGMWIGVSYGNSVEVQFSGSVNGPFATVLTTNAPVAWYWVANSVPVGFYRAKTTWLANPIGCLVSTNAPTP